MRFQSPTSPQLPRHRKNAGKTRLDLEKGAGVHRGADRTQPIASTRSWTPGRLRLPVFAKKYRGGGKLRACRRHTGVSLPLASQRKEPPRSASVAPAGLTIAFLRSWVETGSHLSTATGRPKKAAFASRSSASLMVWKKAADSRLQTAGERSGTLVLTESTRRMGTITSGRRVSLRGHDA